MDVGVKAKSDSHCFRVPRCDFPAPPGSTRCCFAPAASLSYRRVLQLTSTERAGTHPSSPAAAKCSDALRIGAAERSLETASRVNGFGRLVVEVYYLSLQIPVAVH